MASTTSSIQSINGIPICDMEARENTENLQKQLEELETSNTHTHPEYISREEAAGIFATTDYVDEKMEELKTNLDMDKYVTKAELDSIDFITRAEASSVYTTETEVNESIETFKSNELRNYALANDLNELLKRVDNISTRLDAIEKQQANMLAEIEELKNK